eukprot:scaffold38647_cov63-Phaeocystis_antarctica.AAC.2
MGRRLRTLGARTKNHALRLCRRKLGGFNQPTPCMFSICFQDAVSGENNTWRHTKLCARGTSVKTLLSARPRRPIAWACSARKSKARTSAPVPLGQATPHITGDEGDPLVGHSSLGE